MGPCSWPRGVRISARGLLAGHSLDLRHAEENAYVLTPDMIVREIVHQVTVRKASQTACGCAMGSGRMRENCPVAANNLTGVALALYISVYLIIDGFIYKPIWGLFCYLQLNILGEMKSFPRLITMGEGWDVLIV